MTVKISPSILKGIDNLPELKEKIEKNAKKLTTELLEIIFGGAIALKASDLHFEPGEEEAKIRLRIDGILQDVLSIDSRTYNEILSRIKFLSGVKLNIANRPQAGRFTILTDQTSIEARTSTLPTGQGESVVLRILNPKLLIQIEELGVRKGLSKLFQKEIKRPDGMIMVTGPTGSGKTTTLYAFLKKIRKPGIKIITIEDPIEYHLAGITQTQTAPDKGYDFATGLKSVMRQDPDVIMVGEIRDAETCQTAIQAALTGHLVLSTLHTNDAAGTVARLISLQATLTNIGPALNLVIAQRLIRKICPKCKELKKASPAESKKIKDELKRLPKALLPLPLNQDLKIPKARSCKYCNFTGYRNRIGIFEAFLIDDEMEKFLLTNPSIAALREKAVEKGMVLIKQDGFIKVLEGITTIEEVERVTGE